MGVVLILFLQEEILRLCNESGINADGQSNEDTVTELKRQLEEKEKHIKVRNMHMYMYTIYVYIVFVGFKCQI